MHLRIICSELWRCRQVTFLFQKPGNVPSCIHHCAIVAPSAKMFSNYWGHLYNSKSCQFIPMISNYIYDKNILNFRDTSRCPKVDITGILNVFFLHLLPKWHFIIIMSKHLLPNWIYLIIMKTKPRICWQSVSTATAVRQQQGY